MITNVLDIYNRMYVASDNIKGETIDYNRGFQDAVYMLKMALEKYEHINLHIENKRLRYDLFVAQLALDDKYEDRHVLKAQVNNLKQQVNDMRPKKFKVGNGMVDLNRVEFEYGEDKMSFYINAELEFLNQLWADASMTAIKKKPKHATDVKARMMEYFRKKGFRCEAK